MRARDEAVSNDRWLGVRILILVLILIRVVPGTVSPVSGAGLRGLMDGWLLSPSDTVLVLEGREQLGGIAEQCLPPRGGWISVGQAHLFGMPELAVTSLGGQWRGSGIGLGWVADLSWERTGETLFLEDEKRAFLGLGSGTVAGFEFCRRVIWIEEEAEAVHSASILVLRHTRVLRSEFLLRLGWRFDLTDAPVWYGEQGRRALGTVSLLVPRHGFGIAGNLDRRGDGTPGLSLDLSGSAFGRCGLGLRADLPTGSLGPITLWKFGALLIRTSHVVHPDLGLTHRMNLIVRRRAAVRR
jgi:hypothetical protein